MKIRLFLNQIVLFPGGTIIIRVFATELVKKVD